MTAAAFAFSPLEPARQFENADKVRHLLAFASLAAAAALSLQAGWRQSAVAACGLLLYGALIEVVQMRLPTRHGDLADLVADGVGIGIGLLLAASARRLWRRSPVG